MAKPVLCRAGLLACCWPFAAPYVCFMENTTWEDGKESPWSITHKKGEFAGARIPFGAKVWFKPSETRPDDVPGKWEPDSLEGVLAGYLMAPGYTWTKQYPVWRVTDSDGLSLHKGVAAADFIVREPFHVGRLVVPDGDWQFPLKARYTLINDSIEGGVEKVKLNEHHF